MKLLFLYPDISNSLGVFSKVVSKLNAISDHLEPSQLQVAFFGKNINQEIFSVLKCKVHFVHLDSNYSPPKLFNQKIFWPLKYELELSFKFNTVFEALCSVEADVLILRDFAMSKSSISFLEKCKSKFKVVLETNTNLYAELMMKRDLHGSWYELEAKKEKKYRKNGLSLVDGIIFVTQELQKLYLKAGFNPEMGAVISNGVNVSEKLSDRPKWTIDQDLRLVFLAGTSSEWNGIDRLRRSLSGYRGKTKITVDIIGLTDEDLVAENFQLNFKGRMSPTDIKSCLTNYHIGISTLSLYKKKMDEACTLKVREYLASGLPVLLAYKDTDLTGNLEFVFRAKNDESLIDFQKVVAWYRTLISDYESLSTRIHSFAKQNLSYSYKASQIIEFGLLQLNS